MSTSRLPSKPRSNAESTVNMDFDALFNEKSFQFSDFQEFTVCRLAQSAVGDITTEAIRALATGS